MVYTSTKIALIILNWNSPDDTVACIDSLLRQTATEMHLIVIDNASSDNSIAVINDFIESRKLDNITLICNSSNLGYAGGINQGFEYAIGHDYQYVGTLNPDATADKLWLESLLCELEVKDAGVATGLLLNGDGSKIDSSGEFYTTWGIPGPRMRGKPSKSAPDTPEYVFGATGGGVIYKTEMLKKIGLLDEKFFMYYEDIDLSFRSQLAGYRVRYTPKAIAYHNQGTSTKKVPGLAVYNTFKNLPILFTKNVPLSLWPTIYPRFILAYTLILGNAIMNGTGWSAIKGFAKSWVFIPHMFRQRFKIQRNRRVSDAYINSIIIHDILPEQTGMRKFRKIFTGK